jgi:hypothetical protein
MFYTLGEINFFLQFYLHKLAHVLSLPVPVKMRARSMLVCAMQVQHNYAKIEVANKGSHFGLGKP